MASTWSGATVATVAPDERWRPLPAPHAAAGGEAGAAPVGDAMFVTLHGTGWPVGSLAGTNVNAFGLPLNCFSCSSGFTASRSMKPVEASFVGSATVWFALDPVTRMPPARSALVSGSALPSFLSSVAPSSEYFSTMAASPYFVPSWPSPPSGSGAVPVRSPPTPPAFVQAAVRPDRSRACPKRCSS